MTIDQVIALIGGLASASCFTIAKVIDVVKKPELDAESLAKAKELAGVKPPTDDEWQDLSNFNWLDSCPSCEKVDHHPFKTLEQALEERDDADDHGTPVFMPNAEGLLIDNSKPKCIKLVAEAEDVNLPVVERTCTGCSFKWFQH